MAVIDPGLTPYLKYKVKFLDNENLANDEWRAMMDWLRDNVNVSGIIYEPDGDHGGYWVFGFENEEDKVKFVLRWL